MIKSITQTTVTPFVTTNDTLHTAKTVLMRLVRDGILCRATSQEDRVRELW